MPNLTSDQVRALNRGLAYLIEGFEILGNVKVAGWQPHVLLYEVADRMLLALESLSECGLNDVAPLHRLQIGELTKARTSKTTGRERKR